MQKYTHFLCKSPLYYMLYYKVMILGSKNARDLDLLFEIPILIQQM